MSVTLSTAARNAACNAIVDLLDGGTGAAGSISFQTAGGSELAACTMSAPAFGDAANGVATANAISQGTVANSSNPSTIALAVFKNKAGTEVFRCAVGMSGSDINLSNTSVNNDDTIDITSLTFTQPAS